MLTKVKKLLFSPLPFLLLSIPAICSASVGSARGGLQQAGSAVYGGAAEAGGASEVPIIIGTLINSALSLLGVVLVVLLIYGGFLWMTAGGNVEQVDKAKKIITNGIVGLVIVMSAYAISTYIIGEIMIATGLTQVDPGSTPDPGSIPEPF